MIDFFKKLMTANSGKSAFDNRTPEETEKLLLLASLALMIETAKSDHEIDPSELDAITKIAQSNRSLLTDDVDSLINEARARVKEATSLYEFTSLINENFKEPQKFLLIQNMWRVAYADGRIDRYEEHIIRKAAELLYVDHARFIEAKLSIAEALS